MLSSVWQMSSFYIEKYNCPCMAIYLNRALLCAAAAIITISSRDEDRRPLTAGETESWYCLPWSGVLRISFFVLIISMNTWYSLQTNMLGYHVIPEFSINCQKNSRLPMLRSASEEQKEEILQQFMHIHLWNRIYYNILLKYYSISDLRSFIYVNWLVRNWKACTNRLDFD